MADGRPKRTKPAALSPRRTAGGSAFLDVGAGEPLVLLHGVGLNAQAWGPQLAAFAKTHRVIAIDLLGHGQSAGPPEQPMLDSYVQQVVGVLDHLDIKTATVAGHSFGGLVAIGLALAHPTRVLRLAVLNSVYQRTPAARASVQQRAEEIARSGSTGDVEKPMERWFGERPQQPAIAKDVRAWLSAVDPRGYAAAYGIFASSDAAFAGQLSQLSMPALFATGSLDANSTPEMASAMAKEAPRGRALVLEGERHMMNLTNPEAVNAALRQLLAEPVTAAPPAAAAIDPRDLRKAFGTFMTGVTVVTTREPDGTLRGFTANSFSSVSLDPPLLLVCLSKAAASCAAFSSAETFAVNILSEGQKAVSGLFASKRPDKFADAAVTTSASGNPLLTGSVAWFDCARHSLVEAGDHVILIGRVLTYAHTDASPLGYARGGYVSLGLEQSAVNAAAEAGRTEVGAILEHAGGLVVLPGDGGALELPHIGRKGEAGSASRLLAWLAAKGIRAKLSFLYAVYEHPDDKTQSIYYRGEADLSAGQGATTVPFDALPWERFRDDATRAMLRRYTAERLQGRYRIYSGDHIKGDVRDVGE